MHRPLTRAVILALALVWSVDAAAKDRPLPAPKKDGTVSLEAALAKRRSIRTLSDAPISAQQLSQVLWAAHGVTDEQGHRTIPSAYAQYPLDVHVLVRSVDGVRHGHYVYVPEGHALRPLADADKDPVGTFFAKAAGKQGWPAKAPVALVIVGDPKRTTAKLGARAEEFARLEAGLAAQAALLQIAALDLASTFVGGFDPKAAQAALGEAPHRIVLAVLPIGKPQ